MKAREPFAYNYLMFRDPTDYLLILFPSLAGILTTVFLNRSTIVDEINPEQIAEQQILVINAYLFSTKIVIMVLLAFFVCYRWSNMQHDGSYGFWLTLGVNKAQFFVRAFTRFMGVIFFGLILGLLTSLYLAGIYIDVGSFIRLSLLILTHLNIAIGVAILLGNVIENPELSAISYLVLYGANIFLNNDDSSILHQLFQSDLQHHLETAWFSFALSLIFGTLMNVASLRLHILLDMEI